MPDPNQQRPPNAPEPARLTEAPPPPASGLEWYGVDAVELEAPTSTNRQVALGLAVQWMVARTRAGIEGANDPARTIDRAEVFLAWLEAGSDG